jgi:hypothetical protein
MSTVYDALPGDGTQLQWMTGSPAAYASLGRVEEIDGLEQSVTAIKKTYLGSTQHEYRPSRLGDPGKLSGKIQYNPNDPNLAAIYSRISAPGTVDQFKIIFNDGDTTPANATFTGFFTKWKLTGMKVESLVIAEFEIQLNVFPTVTVGTP